MTIINQSQITTAIESFHSLLSQGERLTQKIVTKEMTDIYGDSANNKWSWKKATDLIEGALTQYLAGQPSICIEQIEQLQELVPHQRTRSEEQITLQQFSTPLNLAYLAATALGSLTSSDTFLEPSAGTGILAGMTIAKYGIMPSDLILNEISASRREILASVFPKAKLHNINGELINDFLTKETQPDTVLLNPPFSASPSRSRRNPEACLKHLRSALLRLKHGGRLVAIVANWLSPEKYADYFKTLPAQLRLSIFLPGKHYRYHGTTMDTRLLVFDKIDSRDPVKSVNNSDADLNFLLDRVLQLPLRVDLSIDTPAPSLDGLFGNLPLFQLTSIDSNDLFAGLPLFQISHQYSEHTVATSLLPIVTVARTPLPLKAKTVKQDKSSIQSQPAIGYSPLAFGTVVELTYKPIVKDKISMNDGTYQDYQLSAIDINGGGKHPAELAESVAMAAISMPYPKSIPLLPQRVLDEAIVSKEQLEALIYANEAHSQLMDTPWIVDEKGGVSIAEEGDPLGKYARKGFAIGDGTGVGKGLESCLIFMANLLAGRTKAILITKNNDLLKDTRKYWSMLGGNPKSIIPLSKYTQGSKIDATEGILFVTYGTLRTGETADKISRVDQIIEWVGIDADIPICVDESHSLGNCAGDKGSRGSTSASQQGIAGLKLINTLYNARVTYLSATAASKVSNLAYCQRLGLWQTKKFPYHSREEFLGTMEKGGTAVLEVIAQDLKRCGLYMARTLSFNGVKFETSQHQLDASQIEIWNTYAQAFQVIHQHFDAVMEAVGISENGICVNSTAKKDIVSAFEGLKLRFFNSLLCSMKAPTLIKHIEEDLANGHAVVIQLISTGEAMLKRKLAQIDTSDWENLRSMDFTPREDILNYLYHTFPVKLYRIIEDEEGNKISEIIRDADGNTVECQEAAEIRDRMIEDISLLPPLAGLLDRINWHFGADKVAEITTREKRIIYDRENDRFKLDTRGSKAQATEEAAFQGDRKQILVFSAAGGTGRSYQAELSVANQRLRRHYVAEGGWQAVVAVQGIGRTHRSNQKQPPEVVLLTTNVKGELRFTSTIAGRLSTLGAISKGQQNTGNNGLFDEETNDFGSIYAKTALLEFYKMLVTDGAVGSMSLSDFKSFTGLRFTDNKDNLLSDTPPIHTFLNRILALPIDLQNEVFEVFQDLMSTRIREAKNNDSYNRGMETLAAPGGFNLIAEQELQKDTTCYTFERFDKPLFTRLYEAKELSRKPDFAPYRNKETNEVAMVRVYDVDVWYGDRYADKMELRTPSYSIKFTTMSRIQLDKQWKICAIDNQFWSDWESEINQTPGYIVSKFHLVCGLLLPIWKLLPDRTTKVNRLQTNDSRVFLGRYVNNLDIYLLRDRFGIGDKHQSKDPKQLNYLIVEDKQTISLNVGRIKMGLFRGSKRMEILDVRERATLDFLKSLGCFVEVDGVARIFIPLDRAEEILAKLI